MLTETHLEKYARVLFWGMQKARVTSFSPGDVVLVRTDIAALPLAEKVQTLLLEKKLYPVVRINHPSFLEKGYYSGADDTLLSRNPPGEEELYAWTSGLISLLAPDSVTHLSGVNPAKIAVATRARKQLHDILDRRESRRLFGWTLCLMPTAALARSAGMTEDQYAGQIIRSAYLDEEDPVARWEDFFQRAETAKAWLNRMAVDHYRVRSASTDLKIYPGAQRRWIGVSGHNIPSFELFTSPDCRRTEGVFHADQPCYRNGNRVQGVTLRFWKGRAELVSADEGGEFVRAQLSMDAGACQLGEFSLTDKRFSRIDAFMAHTLFDENYGGEHGNCHVAVGSSYADTYAGSPEELTAERKKELGFNDSALHWDLVNTEPKTVTAMLQGGGSTVIYEDGMFRVPDEV